MGRFISGVVASAGICGSLYFGNHAWEDTKELPAQIARTGVSAIGEKVGLGKTQELAPPESKETGRHVVRIFMYQESIKPFLPLKTSNDMLLAFESALVAAIAGGIWSASSGGSSGQRKLEAYNKHYGI